MKKKIIKEEVFDSYFELVYATAKEMFDYYQNFTVNKDYNFEWFDHRQGARFIQYDNDEKELNKKDVIWIRSDLNLPAGGIYTLAHELIHYVTYRFDVLGVKYYCGNDEQFAYLHGCLFRKCWRFLGDFTCKKLDKKKKK